MNEQLNVTFTLLKTSKMMCNLLTMNHLNKFCTSATIELFANSTVQFA